MDNMNICDMCGFVAKTKKITQHKKTHDTGDFSCDTCPKKFTRLQSLREHVSKVHSTNKFSCTICDKGFSLKTRLKQHEDIHKPKISCHHCKKDIKNFDKHIKICKKYNLSSEKSKNVTKCYICNVDCGDLESLRKHISLYHSILCNECGQKFTSNRKLSEHIKIRHREPSECQYCQKKIRSSIKRHIDAKHKVEFGNNFRYVKEKCKLKAEGIALQFLRYCDLPS